MRVKIKRPHQVSRNGIDCTTVLAGEVHDLPEKTAQGMIRDGLAVAHEGDAPAAPAAAPAQPTVPETQTPPPIETKIDAPDAVKRGPGRPPGSGRAKFVEPEGDGS